jgi:POT family proton-dependent oligopeptide transporter
MNSNSDTSFFGHPRGLSTLFFTEMWERFSYYGTRAILILFMTNAVTGGGLGFDVPKASAIYGMYAAMVYLLGLPGGWIADRFLGQQKAVLWGGIFIAAGNAGLAIPNIAAFYMGLGLISIGTGLLKPNVSTIVGQIYKPGDVRRDAGFSIFYMGINTGALISPLICGYLGERVNWHMGFAVASGCMVLGLIQYTLGRKHLGEAGLHPVKAENTAAESAQRRQLWTGLGVTAVVVAGVVMLAMNGTVSIININSVFGGFLAVIAIGTFSWLIVFSDWTPEERKRLIVVLFLFLASVVFWSIFEQAGSTLNLFAERNTDLHAFGYSFPASWFQAVNSIFLIAFAPVLAWLWIKLGDHDLSSPVKFGLGLILVSLGVLVLIPAAQASGRVSPMWLVATYLLHTIGELCLSPVGLSAMTKLAPTRIAGLTMGVWFLSVSIGNYNAGKLSSMFESMPLPSLFLFQGVAAIAAGAALLLLSRMINRLMGGIR